MKFSNLPRIYSNLNINVNQILSFDNDVFHYCKSVLRMKLSYEFRIFNDSDGEYLAKIIEINKSNLKVFILRNLRDIKAEPKLDLALAIIKPDRFIEAIKSAVQLGVTRIVPIITEYTQFKNINYERIMKCIIETTEQCERLLIPILDKPITLIELISHPNIQQIIFANENENSTKINLIKDFKNSTTLLIGPEGGFSPNEKNFLLNSEKVISVSLGATVLRSEVAVSAIIANVNLMRN